MAINQEQMFRVTVTVAGRDLGVWDTFEGGQVGSDSELYYPGGMADGVALIGLVGTEEVTVSRFFDAELHALDKGFLTNNINGEITIGKQALTRTKDGVEGALETFRGVLTGVGTPQHDSNGNSVSMIELTATISGLPVMS